MKAWLAAIELNYVQLYLTLLAFYGRGWSTLYELLLNTYRCTLWWCRSASTSRARLLTYHWTTVSIRWWIIAPGRRIRKSCCGWLVSTHGCLWIVTSLRLWLISPLWRWLVSPLRRWLVSTHLGGWIASGLWLHETLSRQGRVNMNITILHVYTHWLRWRICSAALVLVVWIHGLSVRVYNRGELRPPSRETIAKTLI